MSSPTVSERIREWAARRHIPEVHLRRWLALPETDRTALLAFAEKLRLRTGQFVTAFELLDEIAVRERQEIARILARPEILAILAASGSGPGKARALLDTLRAIRYPRLHQASARLAAMRAALDLPPSIGLFFPRDLGSDELRLEIRAHGAADLKHLLEALANKSVELCRLAAALGGNDEV
jgi:hypothetical protein